MRKLMFKGFLKQYVVALSGHGSAGIYRLASEAAASNPRLREPLFLYALFCGKEDVLMLAAKDKGMQHEYAALLRRYDRHGMEQALLCKSPDLPERYARVYRSYAAIMEELQNNRHVKMLMRERIIKLKNEQKISTYRIYADLSLNHGNVNTYIKNGDCSKVSLKTARSILSYLENTDCVQRTNRC